MWLIGTLNQTISNPIWYLDFRPTNSSKPLTGSMGSEWHTVDVPFDVYTSLGGDYGFGQTNVPISVSMPNLTPANNGSEKISVAVSSQDAGGGSYAMLGYMLDQTTGTTFDRSRERSLILNASTDDITIAFSQAGTYKMYLNTNIPSELLPVFTSVIRSTIYDDSNISQSFYDVNFDAVDRTLTSSELNDSGWYTNDVDGECVFTVGVGWRVVFSSIGSGADFGAVIGQIAIEKID